MELFHGTNTSLHSGPTDRNAKFRFSVDWSLCRKETDFGRGFYTTTSDHQAAQWANNGVRRLLSSREFATTALLLKFRVDRNNPARLDVLSFVRATPDYFDFVDYCRSLGKPHRRQRGYPAKYDVVHGPVSLGGQKLVIHDSDQVSFHTAKAFQCLCSEAVEVVGVGVLGTGLLP